MSEASSPGAYKLQIISTKNDRIARQTTSRATWPCEDIFSIILCVLDHEVVIAIRVCVYCTLIKTLLIRLSIILY